MKNIFKSKRNILIMMFALVVIMGIGFAAYSQQLKINETSSINSNWDVYIKSVDVKNTKGGATGNGTVDSKTSASLSTDLKYPGDNVIYNITVANDGTIDALLEKINFNMEKENTVIKYYYSVDDEATWNEVTKDSENPYDVDLLANTTDEFQVKIEYDPTKTGTATETQKSNKLTLNIDYVQKTGGAIVPIDTITIDELKTKAVTTGDGLYTDEYEGGRYIYKGANPTNYITFNNETWRIISIESDGTLKIIREFVEDYNSSGNYTMIIKSFDSEGYRDSNSNGAGGTYCSVGNWGNTAGCNAWTTSDNFVNGAYSVDVYSGTVLKDAEINTYLNNDYYNNLSSDAKRLIQTHDFGIGSVKSNNEDLASQIISENSIKWNGNIGLMSASDVIRANTNVSQCGNLKNNYTNRKTCKDTNYIIPKSSNRTIWTISPCLDSNSNVINVHAATGAISPNIAENSYVILPVLYLTSDITLSGEGTSSNPYTIVAK